MPYMTSDSEGNISQDPFSHIAKELFEPGLGRRFGFKKIFRPVAKLVKVVKVLSTPFAVPKMILKAVTGRTGKPPSPVGEPPPHATPIPETMAPTQMQQSAAPAYQVPSQPYSPPQPMQTSPAPESAYSQYGRQPQPEYPQPAGYGDTDQEESPEPQGAPEPGEVPGIPAPTESADEEDQVTSAIEGCCGSFVTVPMGMVVPGNASPVRQDYLHPRSWASALGADRPGHPRRRMHGKHHGPFRWVRIRGVWKKFHHRRVAK